MIERNYQMLSQKQLKILKKEVKEESALGVGFLVGIEKAIPDNTLYDAIRQLADEGDIHTLTDAELQNRLVTKSIELMSYQEFKEIAPYLFSYRRAEVRLAKQLMATPLPVNQAIFDAVKGRGNRLFERLTVPDALDELLWTNDLTLLALNPKTNELLLVDSSPDLEDIVEEQDRLLSESFLSSSEQALMNSSERAAYYIIPLTDLAEQPLEEVLLKAPLTLFDAQYLEGSDEELLEVLDYNNDLKDFELLDKCYDEVIQTLNRERCRELEQERML
ncbi:hypothetical protein [Streptococcus canis]|uniref:hypothetical protein n=2 Tax=Streptococcus canis TaxID=1329 RepID=UPI0020B15804|nr:hypothetical protein [Streptococcus canis]